MSYNFVQSAGSQHPLFEQGRPITYLLRNLSAHAASGKLLGLPGMAPAYVALPLSLRAIETVVLFHWPHSSMGAVGRRGLAIGALNSPVNSLHITLTLPTDANSRA